MLLTDHWLALLTDHLKANFSLGLLAWIYEFTIH